MVAPVWKTPAGKIDTIEERQLYSFQLLAEDADSTALTYSKIAGTLPPGIELTTLGELRGVPFEVATRSLYTFVVRVSDGTNIADRTFNIQVQGADAPRFVTASGTLDMSDSTRAETSWVLDGSYIKFQIQAIDEDTPTGQTLVYDIVSGVLPPGITMNTSGLISGVVGLTADQRYAPIGGYDNVYTFGDTYDPTIRTLSRSQNFEFAVRVTDGASYATQTNNIFVFTSDFWRVDNNRLSMDMIQYQGYPLVMSNSANRRPVFSTDSNLGVFRHDNQVVIKIDVVDADPLTGDLEYHITAGTLPPGLQVDVNSGEIYGQLGVQSAIELEYRFTLRAQRISVSGTTVYTDQEFTLSTIGDIDIGINFITASNLGAIQPGIPCVFSVEANTPMQILQPDEVSNRVFSYSVTSGSLPPGLSLSLSGNIVGQVDKTDFLILDNNSTTFDNNTTTTEKEYAFVVGVSDQYQTLATSKEFRITVNLPYSTEYGNITVGGLISNKKNSTSDLDLFYSISQDVTINNNDNIFRAEDSAFGIPPKPEMLLVAGLEHQTINELQQAMLLNHTPKILYFGDIKTAVAKENGVVKYEVVYVEMKDNLINTQGKSIAKSITLRSDIYKPLLGPRADDDHISTDYTIYTVTTHGGLSFNLSGSKLKYANLLTADIGYFEKLFPNAVTHMRSNMKDLGQKEYVHLPLWMRTAQDSSGAPLGYTMAVPLAYCKPGKSGLLKDKILRKKIDFKKIQFRFDRYATTINTIDAADFASDGSTKSYTLNEIVHEEEIKIRDNAHTMKYGQQVTADNYAYPGYLSADTVLRSSDYETGFYLTHNENTLKTTVNFTNAPKPTSKIRVERKGDKYLAFKRKLKE